MPDNEIVELFDGETLNGWHAIPRLYTPLYVGGEPLWIDTEEYRTGATTYPARWSVEDGAIVGEQWPAGSKFGGFLVSDRSFDDFVLTIEANPDWPVDSGILLRKEEPNWRGIQVLLDHRESGGIGGFYGNGIGGFHALGYSLRSIGGETNPTGIAIEDPADSLEPWAPEKGELLSYSAPPEAFLDAWRWADWNEFTIRCVGVFPTVTVHINGVLISEINLDTMQHPRYDKHAMLDVLGRGGPIALEVHDSGPGLGPERWGLGAKTRFRNIRIQPLPLTDPTATTR